MAGKLPDLGDPAVVIATADKWAWIGDRSWPWAIVGEHVPGMHEKNFPFGPVLLLAIGLWPHQASKRLWWGLAASALLAVLFADHISPFSDALLGALAAVGPSASAAIQALDAGDAAEYRRILGPTEELSRHVFAVPTQFYKTGVAFLSWLNGRQPAFSMVGAAPWRAFWSGDVRNVGISSQTLVPVVTRRRTLL